MTTGKPSISIKHLDDYFSMSLSIDLSARQRIKMGWLRKNISEYLDSVLTCGEGPINTTKIFQKKTKTYQDRVIRQSLAYQNYLLKSGGTWKPKKSQIPFLFFPIREVKIDSIRSTIAFPKELDFGEGFFNYFSFNILKDKTDTSIEWIKLIFVGEFIFCEVKTHLRNIDWSELAKFNLYEIGISEDSQEHHEEELTHWLPV